jgi:hypothetical protein
MKKKVKQKAEQKLLWILVGAGAAMLASNVVEKSLEAGWRAVMSDDPPSRPESPHTAWGEALAWTAASALAIGLSQVLAKRGTAIGWQYATGRMPPV